MLNIHCALIYCSLTLLLTLFQQCRKLSAALFDLFELLSFSTTLCITHNVIRLPRQYIALIICMSLLPGVAVVPGVPPAHVTILQIPLGSCGLAGSCGRQLWQAAVAGSCGRRARMLGLQCQLHNAH